MAGKKKTMDGGINFMNLQRPSLVVNKSIIKSDPNQNLFNIKKFYSSFQKINPEININKLNKDVKDFIDLLKRNKINEHKYLLEEVKKKLIEKIYDKLTPLYEDINSLSNNNNINMSRLIEKLKKFNILSNLLKLLDLSHNEYNEGFKERFNRFKEKIPGLKYNIIKKFLNSYILRTGKKVFTKVFTKDITSLQKLKSEAQNYIDEYSNFYKNINKNNSYFLKNVIDPLLELSKEISDKIELLSRNNSQQLRPR